MVTASSVCQKARLFSPATSRDHTYLALKIAGFEYDESMYLCVYVVFL